MSRKCPSCGHLNRPQATWCEVCRKGLTFGGRMAEPWGKTGIASRITNTWALLTGCGCLLLFVFPPLGLALLGLAIMGQFLFKKAIAGICPHCGRDIGTFRMMTGRVDFPCQSCGRLIVIDESSGKPVFVKAADPFAAENPGGVEAAWTPLGGAANFRTKELVQVDPDLIEFRASGQSNRFYLVFVIMGALILVLSIRGANTGEVQGNPTFGILVGFLFVSFGAYPYLRGNVPLVFDKRSGLFTRERTARGESSVGKSPGSGTRLDDIHALQLISKRESGKRRYTCFELNLVLRNGERIHVVSHGGTDKLREDARTLAAFLNKPLWDKT